ncbi:MAG: peroxiredoxin [FCB group bacterium]|jgi:peroxiredoxin (alkyl hydroperoxide reductase subunit C)
MIQSKLSYLTFISIILILLINFSDTFAQKKQISPLLIGDEAPSFVAQSTDGEINFPRDYMKKWVIFFSHPGDFTPVCTTELIEFARMQDEFKKYNCELLGLSVDVLESHISWISEIKKIKFNDQDNIKINFPLISDANRDIAHKYGMIANNASSTRTVRAVFIIDPNSIIRTILYYPSNTGRNINEILRILLALQLDDKEEVVTPANWEPGDNVLVPPSGDPLFDMERFKNHSSEYICPAWFLCYKKLSKDRALAP